MARPKKVNEVRLWDERISKAKKFREEDFDAKFQCEKSRRWFEGSQAPDAGVPAGEWITVNKIYSHLLTELPALYGIDPYYYVKLKKSYDPAPEAIAQFEQAGKIRESYLNYLKVESRLKEKARLAILDAEFAFGVIKIHYVANFEDNPEAGNPLTDENGEPVVDDDGKPMEQPDQLLVDEKYRLSRIHPDNILFDRDAGPLEEDWGWVAQKIELTRAQAEADKTLDARAVSTATKKKRREENETGGKIDISGQLGPSDPDLKRKQFLKVLEGAEALAQEPSALPKGMECHPFCFLRFVLRDKSPFPIPPVSQALDQQRELNEARSKALVHRKRFNRKYEVNASLLESDAEIDKLVTGEDGTVLMVQQIGAVNPIKDAPLDPQTYTEIGAINRDLLELMGPSPDAFQVSRADSATEAALVDQRLSLREGDKLSMVAEWIQDIGKKLDQLVQAHITRDEAVRVTGPQGDQWQLVRADDYAEIAGEFEYSVNVGASQPRNPQVERSQWLAFLQVVGNFPQLMTSPRLMNHMAELHQIDDEQMVQEMIQIGQQMMQMEQQQQAAPVAGVPTNNPVTAMLGQMGQGAGMDNTEAA
jgi:hypothetical protein